MKLKTARIATIIITSIIGIGSILVFPTYAVDICTNPNISDEVKEANGCTGSDKLPGLIQNILYAIIGVAGLISAIFIIVGGINYMTSSGDSAKVKKAKDTILYACIGLIICVLSFAIVNWVIGIL